MQRVSFIGSGYADLESFADGVESEIWRKYGRIASAVRMGSLEGVWELLAKVKCRRRFASKAPGVGGTPAHPRAGLKSLEKKPLNPFSIQIC